MNPRDFIQQVFLAELSQIAEKHHFISFSLVGLGTEFLGACLDTYDFEERNLSGLRFRGAVKALYPSFIPSICKSACVAFEEWICTPISSRHKTGINQAGRGSF